MIGPSIRRAVNAAMAGMEEKLNQSLEKSFTLDSLKWRMEASRTGKPYSQIMLLRSSRYCVEQVFLIHRATGSLLALAASDESLIRDSDHISKLVHSIQEFASDAADGLEKIQVNDYTVWVQQGPLAMLAAVIRGVPPPELRGVFEKASESIHQEHSGLLQNFHSDTAPFAAVLPKLSSCLLGQSAVNGPPKRSRILPIAITLLCLAAAVWGFFALLDRYRSNQYLEVLKKEPGISVANSEWHAGRFTIYGMRDPMSRDPLSLANQTGLEPSRLDLHLSPYQSLDPAFTARRKLEAEQENVENTVLRFDMGSTVLQAPAIDRLEEMVGHLKTLFSIASAVGTPLRVEVIGHTDSMGPGEINAVLAEGRAAAVVSEMRALGVKDSQFQQKAVGDQQPVRTGTSERDHSFNRSVSFRVIKGE